MNEYTISLSNDDKEMIDLITADRLGEQISDVTDAKRVATIEAILAARCSTEASNNQRDLG